MTLRVGVVGVGNMGRHHARVYAELQGADLVGVADADSERARAVADDHDTSARTVGDLLADADAVSVAVPTAHHARVAGRALDAGVHVLVEKPFVEDPEVGRELIRRADERDLVLGVGHVERFNPAVRVLGDVLADEEIIAVDARRLGPPVDREVGDVVLDLMIHDIDVACSLVDADVYGVTATRAGDAPHVSATLSFENGVVGTLTASRTTHRKVRRLAVTTRDCRVDVDYISQSVDVYRRSLPEYVETDTDVRYRTETVVEQPTIQNGEPLKAELAAFVEAVREGAAPPVTGADGLRALELARAVRDAAKNGRPPEVTAQ